MKGKRGRQWTRSEMGKKIKGNIYPEVVPLTVTSFMVWATIIRLSTAVLLKLLWLGLKYSELCKLSDAPQCEHCPCDALPHPQLCWLICGQGVSCPLLTRKG